MGKLFSPAGKLESNLMHPLPLLFTRRLFERPRGGLVVDQVLRVGPALSRKPNWPHEYGRRMQQVSYSGEKYKEMRSVDYSSSVYLWGAGQEIMLL